MFVSLLKKVEYTNKMQLVGHFIRNRVFVKKSGSDLFEGYGCENLFIKFKKS